MSRRTRRAKLVKAKTTELEKSLLARDHLQDKKPAVRRAPGGPEVIYLRRLGAREVRHTTDPEELAAEAEHRFGSMAD